MLGEKVAISVPVHPKGVGALCGQVRLFHIELIFMDLDLCMITAPPYGHRMMTQKGTSRNSCLVPYTLQPFKALAPEGKPFEGIRA